MSHVSRLLTRTMLCGSLLLASCSGTSGEGEPSPGEGQPEDSGNVAQAEVRVPLEGPRLLRRLSLDLRGVLPTDAELDAVVADPDALDGLVLEWLEEPAFEERLVHLLAEQWHTRVDEFLILYRDYPQIADDSQVEYAFERSVGEEPLRLAARIVAEDRSWAEVVTSDTTVANELLAEIWPLEREEGEGWTEARYTDGRPAMGILATNGLWWRYFTTVTNYNRGRVAALTRMLICVDYAGRTISFSESDALAAGAEVEDALRQSPPCMGCHSSIDPVASVLFGFWPANEYNVDEVDHYHPEREALGPELLQVEPAWYGDPVVSPGELGAHIARDPRFSRCAVDTFAQGLWDRTLSVDDEVVLSQLDTDFQADELRVKPLIAELVRQPAYTVGGLTADADAATAERAQTLRMLTPDQLQSVFTDLSGLVWTYGGYQQLDNDTKGYRILGGGVDGEEVGRPQRVPSLTSMLVDQRAAEAAAYKLVAAELGAGSEARILDSANLDTQPDDAAFTEQLDSLRWRLLALKSDEQWNSQLTTLWEAVEAEDGPEAAWRAVVAASLQDPYFIGY